jgi:hypothetical protein
VQFHLRGSHGREQFFHRFFCYSASVRITNLTRKAFVLCAGALSILLFTGEYGISKDELECEQAAQHLFDCCPNLAQLPFTCTSGNGGCGGDHHDDSGLPFMGETTSHCIRLTTCNDLVSSGACDAPLEASCP